MRSTPVDDQTDSFAAQISVQRLLVVKLATLRRIVQRSAGLAFGRETGLSDFDWLVVWFIGVRGAPTATEVSECLQRDKGQVSRAVSRLTRAGIVARSQLRSPLTLTPRGEDVLARIERLVASRNQALFAGVTDEQRAMLSATIDALFKNGDAILANERRLERGDDASGTNEAEPPAREPWRPSRLQQDPPLLAPDLYLLLRLLQRSADLAYSRVTGLSNFDWRMVTHISVNGPLTLADLIISADRNKSQVGRAVERLVTLGLIDRKKEPGVSSVVLSLTRAGATAYATIETEARRRDAVLVEALSAAEHRCLQNVLDRLTENALGLVARERSIEAASGRTARSIPADE